jgi:hypothetical protein
MARHTNNASREAYLRVLLLGNGKKDIGCPGRKSAASDYVVSITWSLLAEVPIHQYAQAVPFEYWPNLFGPANYRGLAVSVLLTLAVEDISEISRSPSSSFAMCSSAEFSSG